MSILMDDWYTLLYTCIQEMCFDNDHGEYDARKDYTESQMSLPTK